MSNIYPTFPYLGSLPQWDDRNENFPITGISETFRVGEQE